jgi:hypothetical protein
MPPTGLRAGAARLDITPPPGGDMTGFLAREGPSLGTHDPLHARALVLDDGATRAALLTCDLLGLDAGAVARARALVSAAARVPAEHIMVACTHTHAGPASMHLTHCGEVDAAWLAALEARLAEAAALAAADMRPARASAGCVTVGGVSANRRTPGGPADRELDVLRLEGPGGTIAALLAFACHPVAAGHQNRLFSADIFGPLAARVEAAAGAVALAACGACGDVNPTWGPPPEPGVALPGAGFPLVERVGAALAEAALGIWPALAPLGEGLAVRSARLELPLGPIPDEAEVAALAEGWRAALARPADPGSAWGLKEPAAMLAWAAQVGQNRARAALRADLEAEVQVIEVGGLALVAVPGELFAELGLAIRRGAAALGKRAVVLAYANGNLGYIPTRGAYPEGGYEVASAYRFYGYPAALAPEAGERVVAAALALLGGT